MVFEVPFFRRRLSACLQIAVPSNGVYHAAPSPVPGKELTPLFPAYLPPMVG